MGHNKTSTLPNAQALLLMNEYDNYSNSIEDEISLNTN